MQCGWFVPFDQMPKVRRICPCCGVMKMPTEEELEQRITAQIDKDSFERAILEAINKGLVLEAINNKPKAVEQ